MKLKEKKKKSSFIREEYQEKNVRSCLKTQELK